MYDQLSQLTSCFKYPQELAYLVVIRHNQNIPNDFATRELEPQVNSVVMNFVKWFLSPSVYFILYLPDNYILFFCDRYNEKIISFVKTYQFNMT